MTASLILVFSIGGCLRFKVSNLNPALVSKIKIGEGLNLIEGIIINNVITNIPLQVPLDGDKVFVTDLKNSFIKVFDTNGSIEYILGTPPQKNLQKIKFLPVKFGVIGTIIPGNKDDLFVQNRMNAKDQFPKLPGPNQYQKYSGQFDIDEEGSLPSYILHISKKGTVETILGVTGANSEPFRYIEKMYSFEDGELFVYHRHAEEMILSHFVNGELKSSLKEGSLKIFSEEDSKKYKIKLESMIPHSSGKYALVVFSYFNKTDGRFKFRKVYRYLFNSTTPEAMLKEIQDPSEYLFSVKKNGDFYIWETEDNGNSVKLQLHDSEGNHVDNLRLTFTLPRGQWRETYTDAEDNILSVRTKSGHLELYKWK
ncbi:MAG: hypothetical protein K8R21_04880 [Leptospira sp.]|nr:hypothetical protein [Leptospira sp.]